jgi:hypothetical protein
MPNIMKIPILTNRNDNYLEYYAGELIIYPNIVKQCIKYALGAKLLPVIHYYLYAYSDQERKDLQKKYKL